MRVERHSPETRQDQSGILPRVNFLALAAAAILCVGFGLRLWHYARNPCMWHDEAATVANIFETNYSAITGPLSRNQAIPPLFLAAERAAMQLFGDSEFAFRLLPFVASCLMLLLVALAAR